MERKRAKTFQDLIVWQKAHQFVLSVYKVMLPAHSAGHPGNYFFYFWIV
jgi:hypothetical protein